MLTVREALEMPVFAEARVVAGRAGLDNQIRWVHIVDIPDAHYEWGRRGVFLLTAGFCLRDDPQRQAALVPRLVELGFAGMVLSIGYYFQDTPRVIRKAADELGFPVIETPRELLFIDITEAIFGQIVNRQYALLRQSARIHEQLTNLVLQGGGLNDLALTLAGILERSVSIEDPSFRLLAAAQHGLVDDARHRSVTHGRTTPEVAQRLLDKGIYDELLKRMEPIHVPPMPDLGMSMERIVAPIIVDRAIHGYVWIIAGDHPLTDLDELAIDHGATVAALIMFKEEAVHEAEEAVRGDFFEQLLTGASDSAAFEEQARQLNYRPGAPHQVLVVHDTRRAGGSAHPLLDAVEEWLRDRGVRVFMVWRDEGLVMVTEGGDAAAGRRLAAALVKDLTHPARRLLVGVGGAFEPADGESVGIRRSYEEAREAVRVGAAMGRQEGVVAFDDLGLLHWLYHVPLEQRADNVYLQHIHALASYDAGHNTELTRTLETYLDHGSSLVDAAEILYIHRNTLLYRLQRIEALCPVDLHDPLQRLNLHAAIKSYRLHESDT